MRIKTAKGGAGRHSNATATRERVKGMNIFRTIDSTLVPKASRRFSLDDFKDLHDTLVSPTMEDRECFPGMKSYYEPKVFKSKRFGKSFLWFSEQEMAFLMRAESFSSIVGLWSRPYILPYDADLYCRFSVDFLCLFEDGHAAIVQLCDFRRYTVTDELSKFISLKRFCEQKGYSILIADFVNGISLKFIVDKYRELPEKLTDRFKGLCRSIGKDWFSYRDVSGFVRENFVNFPVFFALCLSAGVEYFHKHEIRKYNTMHKSPLLWSARAMLDSLASSDYTTLRDSMEQEGRVLSGGESCMAHEPMIEYGTRRKCSQREVFRNVIAVERDGRHGIMNRHGDVVIEPVYDDVIVATQTDENSVASIVFICLMGREMRLYCFDGSKAVEIPVQVTV